MVRFVFAPIRCIDQRKLMAIECWLGLTISYIMRYCISMVITIMVKPSPHRKGDPYSCPGNPGGVSKNVSSDAEFDWSPHLQGIILSSFFWGYVLTQIPGGMLADRFGGKVVLGWGVFGTSLATLSVPAITHYGDWPGLIIIRIVTGMIQGVVYSSLHTMVAHWIPIQERGLWGSLVFSGAHSGMMCSMFGTGHMLAAWRWWPLPFYVYGTIGIIWSIIFYLTATSDPDYHPYISEKEKAILDQYKVDVAAIEGAKDTPWKSIWTSMPVWAILIGMIGHDFGLFALVSDVPKYLSSVLHFNVKSNASLGPAVGLMMCSYSGCNVTLAVIWMICGMSLMGFFYPSLKVNPIDLSMNYAGTIGAMGHAVGAISGIIVPYLIGSITPNETLMEWRVVFWITFGVMMLTNIFYIIFASGELQPWNSE